MSTHYVCEKYHRLSYNLFLTPHLYIYSVLKKSHSTDSGALSHHTRTWRKDALVMLFVGQVAAAQAAFSHLIGL